MAKIHSHLRKLSFRVSEADRVTLKEPVLPRIPTMGVEMRSLRHSGRSVEMVNDWVRNEHRPKCDRQFYVRLENHVDLTVAEGHIVGYYMILKCIRSAGSNGK